MSYVDGLVVPVPKAKLSDYKKLAQLACEVWLEHGALDYREWIAEDVKPGKLTSFPQAVQLKDDEVISLSWVVYKNKEDRDRIAKAVMDDPQLKETMGDPSNMPFDGKRMFWGGFRTFLGLSAGS